MGVPFGGDDTVAIAALEACGYRTLAFVDDYPVLLVYISQYIIAGDGVAAVGHDIVLLDGLFRQFQYLLGIDFFLRNFLFGLLLRVFVVFIAERESQEFLPVGALFSFRRCENDLIFSFELNLSMAVGVHKPRKLSAKVCRFVSVPEIFHFIILKIIHDI